MSKGREKERERESGVLGYKKRKKKLHIAPVLHSMFCLRLTCHFLLFLRFHNCLEFYQYIEVVYLSNSLFDVTFFFFLSLVVVKQQSMCIWTVKRPIG